MIKFTVIGQAVAKARPRSFRRSNFVGTYTPANTRKWEELVRLQSIQYKPDRPYEGAIRLGIIFHLLRPKSLPRKIIHHTKKPDCENLSKSILDSLEGIFYHNDSQIISLTVLKQYTLDIPKVEMEIEEI